MRGSLQERFGYRFSHFVLRKSGRRCRQIGEGSGEKLFKRRRRCAVNTHGQWVKDVAEFRDGLLVLVELLDVSGDRILRHHKIWGTNSLGRWQTR